MQRAIIYLYLFKKMKDFDGDGHDDHDDDASEKLDSRVPIRGRCAGAAAKTVPPLDRTKIMFQTTNRKFSYRAAAAQLQNG